ncbi:MAG: ATP-dependent DNA ligase [Actinobacteria bacterium]|nr:ATP-dependent DNA ligase [Actinomycetota bacterium]
MRAGSRTIQVSNLDKVFYPDGGFTKGDMLDYYRRVGRVLIPHLRDRPLTLKRYPDGVEGQFFYEKRCPPHAPGWVKTVPIERKRDGKIINYCMVNDVASLLWAVNLGSLELHVSLAKAKKLGTPTTMVFDLDPDPEQGVLGAAEVALEIRKRLARFEIESFVKTSGSKGLQLYVPLQTAVTYEQTGGFAHALARALEEEMPERVVSKMKKELRKGKVLIDWSQNDDHKTTVAVYSLRARPAPTVSTPVQWKEVRKAVRDDDPDLLSFTWDEVLTRLDKHGDLFEPVRKMRQKLPTF